jgi:hypothetical protein
MPNPYYIRTFDVLPGNRVGSQAHEDEYELVEQGFEGVDTDLQAEEAARIAADALKATKAGETYTGAHDFTGADVEVATQAPGDSSTKAASTQYVDDTAFSTATGLPIASQAEMEAGTEVGLRAMSPLRVAQAIAALTDPHREARATNTVFAATDSGKLIEYTGSFTQTFGTAASLGDGWRVILKNAFTDSVYLTPAGGATIDGAADRLMYPGEALLLQCDGTNFHSVILQPGYASFTASGFFFKQPGYTKYGGLLWGGGGSGGAVTDASHIATGGGGGACVPFLLDASQLGTSETVTIGAGGVAVAVGNSGNVGGTSSLGSLVLAYGGGGGTLNAATAANVGGGGGGGWLSAGGTAAGSGGDGGTPADSGSFGGRTTTHDDTAAAKSSTYGGAGGSTMTSTPAQAAGGSSLYGGAGGGGTANSATVAGGTSKFGGNGGAAGVAGSVPGGGGGGKAAANSGAGGAGKLIIWGIV